MRPSAFRRLVGGENFSKWKFFGVDAEAGQSTARASTIGGGPQT